MNYPALILKKGREKSVLNHHPWVFSGAVYREPPANAGEIIEIRDARDTCLGLGFYEPASQIIARIFHFGNPVSIDENFWVQRIEAALRLRKTILPPGTTGYRLVNGEGDFLPGLIIDIYDTTASIQLNTSGMIQLSNSWIEILSSYGIRQVFVEAGNNQYWTVEKNQDQHLVFQENHLTFYSDPGQGQKTGFFLDQRDNRQLVRLYSGGRKVLNAFSYSGAFSVYALAGGAASVDSVDISQSALELTEKNLALNFDSFPGHQAIQADCFSFLRSMAAKKYDLVILDPPAFAKSKAAVDRAARGYKDINLQAFQKIEADGLVFSFSCSQHISADLFQKILFAAAKDSGRDVRILQQLGQASDHPVNIYHPEGAYLKGFLLQVL